MKIKNKIGILMVVLTVSLALILGFTIWHAGIYHSKNYHMETKNKSEFIVKIKFPERKNMSYNKQLKDFDLTKKCLVLFEENHQKFETRMNYLLNNGYIVSSTNSEVTSYEHDCVYWQAILIKKVKT